MTKRQPAGHPANSTAYKNARRAFMARQGPAGICALCGEPVDMRLSGRVALGPTVDHVQPSSAGGSFYDPSNWQLAHRRCNAAKGRGAALGAAPGSRGAGDRRFRPDGHWNDAPTGREPASPNGLECDNPACAWCLAEGYRT